jgi:ribosomal protein S18 acetylase RimI-like enzyme
MIALPPVGSRVSVRYRLPVGSAAPLTDVIGHLEQIDPAVVVRTKSGELIGIAAHDIVSVRELSHTPVRTSEIRALEHAAALAWPGVEQQWLRGWFLRAGHGVTSRANSAVPLGVCAQIADLPAVIAWYRDRGLPARLALPERLLPVRAAGAKQTRVLVRDVTGADPAAATLLLERPEDRWRALYERDVPLEELTAVIDGQLTFALRADAAVGRGAVTDAPDGTRWLGISSVRVAAPQRRQGHARATCAALLGWGAEHGARRAYVEVLEDNDAAIALYSSMGFRLHHRHKYVPAQQLLTSTI